MRAPTKLTVIIRDDSPMWHCDDCPSYRVVTLELTDEQRRLLTLEKTSVSNGRDYYECVSKAILGD